MVINMKIIICTFRASSLLVLLLANTFSYAQVKDIKNDEPVSLESTPTFLEPVKTILDVAVDERLPLKLDRKISEEETALILEIANKRSEKVNLSGSDANTNNQPLNRLNLIGILIPDSVVFKDDSKKFYGIKGSVRLGNYQYELAPGELSSLNESGTTSSTLRRNAPLRLVYFKQNKRYMITDGGLIINFEEIIDKNIFASEYGLNLKYDFGSSAAFKPVPFGLIKNIVEALEKDKRVSSVEFDLIDPHVQEQ
jgi:hypothetical protein